MTCGEVFARFRAGRAFQPDPARSGPIPVRLESPTYLDQLGGGFVP